MLISKILKVNRDNVKFGKSKHLDSRHREYKEIVGENKIIDYLSIDVEGEEERILESIDFNYFNIKVLSVENNYPEQNNHNNLLKDKGFTYFDNYGVDELYYNKKYFKNIDPVLNKNLA